MPMPGTSDEGNNEEQTDIPTGARLKIKRSELCGRNRLNAARLEKEKAKNDQVKDVEKASSEGNKRGDLSEYFTYIRGWQHVSGPAMRKFYQRLEVRRRRWHTSRSKRSAVDKAADLVLRMGDDNHGIKVLAVGVDGMKATTLVVLPQWRDVYSVPWRFTARRVAIS